MNNLIEKLNQSGVIWWFDCPKDPQCFYIDIDQCDGEDLIDRSRVLVEIGLDKNSVSFHAVKTGRRYTAAMMVLIPETF